MWLAYWYLLNCPSEWKKGVHGNLEVLYTEGNADDGQAENSAENGMDDCNLPPSANNPQDIEDGAQTARELGRLHDGMAERHQGENAEFKHLDAERDANDCDAHEESGHKIKQRRDDSSKNKPENVSENVHYEKFCAKVIISVINAK